MSTPVDIFRNLLGRSKSQVLERSRAPAELLVEREVDARSRPYENRRNPSSNVKYASHENPYLKVLMHADLQKTASVLSTLRDSAGKAVRWAGDGVDYLAGSRVSERARKSLDAEGLKRFQEARGYAGKRRVVETQAMPGQARTDTLNEMDALQRNRNLAKGILGGTIGTGAGVKAYKDRKESARQKAHREQVLNYYRQRGMIA